MTRAFAILALLAASGEHHHPPVHLPPPTLHAPPPSAPPAPPNEYVKVISLASCVNTAPYGATSYGATPTGATNSVAALGGAWWITLYCDALLPAEATAFDYAELEYFAPSNSTAALPSLGAYLDVDCLGPNGFNSSYTIEIGQCSGQPLTPASSGTLPISLCQTNTALYVLPDAGSISTMSLLPDAGTFDAWASFGQWTNLSIHFLVSIPPSQGQPSPTVGYRVLVHYEAP